MIKWNIRWLSNGYLIIILSAPPDSSLLVPTTALLHLDQILFSQFPLSFLPLSFFTPVHPMSLFCSPHSFSLSTKETFSYLEYYHVLSLSVPVLLFYCSTVLLFYCSIGLLFYCFIVLLFYCSIVLLFYISLFHCSTVLLFYCPAVLLFYCPIVLLSYFSIVLLFYCPIFLLFYCFIVFLYLFLTLCFLYESLLLQM